MPRIALLLAFLGSVTLSPGGVPASSVSPAQIAAAVNGNIILFRADGRGRQIITHRGTDSNPITSANGQLIAFLRTKGHPQPNGAQSNRHDVMLAEPGNRGGYRVTNFSFGPVTSSAPRHDLAWEPGPHTPGLAWFNGNNVVWRRSSGNPHPVLMAGPPAPAQSYQPIVWLPGDNGIATPIGSPQGSGYPRVLRIVVADFGPTGQHTVAVRFRKGVLGGNQPARGSFPVGNNLTITPDGRHFLFGTVAEGEGGGLTGIFEVPIGGGVARMILGTGNGVKGYPPYGPALDGATQFQLSPNGKYLATDPDNHLWISGVVARPRTIPVPLGRSCVLAEWTWLPNSSGLAYITTCTTPSSPTVFSLALSVVSRNGGKPRLLFEMRSQNQFAIDIAPTVRCVACGG